MTAQALKQTSEERVREPHQVIENGSKRFARLWRQWEELHRSKRYADCYPQKGRDF